LHAVPEGAPGVAHTPEVLQNPLVHWAPLVQADPLASGTSAHWPAVLQNPLVH